MTIGIDEPRPPLMRSSLLHVAVAALAMGGWAAFANVGAGGAPMMRAALVQALLSGAITLALKRSLETMSAVLHGRWAFIPPPLVTCVATLGVLVLAHRLAGTAQLWRTIALPYAVSSSYAWIYSLSLFRAKSAERLIP